MIRSIPVILFFFCCSAAHAQGYAQLLQTRKLIEQEKYEKAIAILDEFIAKTDSVNSDAYTQRGLCYRKTGNYESSLKDLQHARRLNNANEEAHCYLGSAYAMQK